MTWFIDIRHLLLRKDLYSSPCALGIDLREYLPHVDVLLESEELGDLRHNAKFQYLVKAGYEHIQRACEAGGGESV